MLHRNVAESVDAPRHQPPGRRLPLPWPGAAVEAWAAEWARPPLRRAPMCRAL
jgi:hypothetical protein